MRAYPRRRFLTGIATAAAIAAAVLGVSVFLTWHAGISGPLSLASGRQMPPLAAVAFVIAGGSLWLARRPGVLGRWTATWLAALVLLIGAVSLAEHLTSIDTGLANLFDPRERRGSRIPLLSALCFMLQGFALMRPRWWPRARLAAHVAAVISVNIAVAVFIDYLYNASLRYEWNAQSAMSPQTAIVMILLGIGTLTSDPDVALMRVLSRRGPGSDLTRLLLPITLLTPFVLGWFALHGQPFGGVFTATGVGLLATICAVTFTAVVLIYAKRMNDVDRVRSAAQREVAESNQFHQQIIQSAREGLTVIDTEGRVVLFNSFMAEHTGKSAGETVGRQFTDIFPEALGESFQGTLALVFAGHTVEMPDHRRQMATGEEWMGTRFSPIRNAAGDVTGALAITSDVTGRKRNEMELREAQEQTRLALSAASMAAWQVDIAAGAVIWTEELAALFGRSLEELRPSGGGRRFIYQEDEARVVETLEAAMRDHSGFEFDFRVVLPDNSIRWLSSSGRFSDDGTPGGRLSGVTMDVTQRRSLEAQLSQAQKMEAIGRLAGGVAHDFNNLLTAMLGYAEFLDSSELDEQQRLDVQEIIKAANRASTLTRQLLAFSRRQIVQPEILDVNAIVQNLVNMLRRLIGEQITLTTALAPSVRTIRAAPGQIEQIVVNLVVNARDAMPDGGHVRIETANVGLDAKSLDHGMVGPGEYVMLMVTDSGHGMTDEIRARVFEPFFTTKEQGKGTGLGLATVYGIVSQSGGHVSLDSEVGKGTVFRIYLPAAAEEEGETASPASQQAAHLVPGHGTILLVEDEDAVRSMTCMTLQRAGYTVHPASNPQQAQILYYELNRRVDLLLTDVVMPGGSGPELHQRLTASGDRLRVLYMSGYTGQATLEQGRLDLSAPFIQKPFSGENLTRRVRELLAYRAAGPEDPAAA